MPVWAIISSFAPESAFIALRFIRVRTSPAINCLILDSTNWPLRALSLEKDLVPAAYSLNPKLVTSTPAAIAPRGLFSPLLKAAIGPPPSICPSPIILPVLSLSAVNCDQKPLFAPAEAPCPSPPAPAPFAFASRSFDSFLFLSTSSSLDFVTTSSLATLSNFSFLRLAMSEDSPKTLAALSYCSFLPAKTF